MMQQTARSGEKAPLFGGRKPLFTQSQLLKLTWPLLVEQFLAVTSCCFRRWPPAVPWW